MPDPALFPKTKTAGKAPAVKKGRAQGKHPGRASDPHAAREAQRYEHPIPSREAILAFLSERAQMLNAKTLAEELHLTSPRDFEALTRRLGAMLRDGQLLQNRRGGYGVAERLDLIPGSIIANAEGYGFLRPDAGGDDIYISPAQMRKVLHGDRVLASIVGVDRRGRKQADIVEVLERRASRLVGRVSIKNGVVMVVPDDRRLHQDVLIPPGKDSGAQSGQIVIAEITQPPSEHCGPIGEVISVLGERSVAIAGGGDGDSQPRASQRMAGDDIARCGECRAARYA